MSNYLWKFLSANSSTHVYHCSLPMGSPLQAPSSSSKSKHSSLLSHTQAARALGGGEEPSVDPEDDIDSGSDDEEGRYLPNPLMEEDLASTQDILPQDNPTSPSPAPSTPSLVPPIAGKGFKSMVSRMAKKVVNTRIMQRAAEKVSSYPLVLTVEVNRLDGVIAVNIPPPPTDTIW